MLKAASWAALITNAPYWVTIVADAQTSAYQEIVGRLIERGFTEAQINSWDRGAEFELVIMKYWALVNGGGLSGNYDDRFIKMLDRRRELDDVMIAVAGVYITPGQMQPGTINFGTRQGAPRTWPGSADGPAHGHGHRHRRD